MNITEWEKLASEVGLRNEVEEVIKGLEDGFTQGIPEHYKKRRRPDKCTDRSTMKKCM